MMWREVKYQPERTRTYLGSPSIVRLPDRALVATHDYFGSGCPRTHENEEGLTSVYRSEDDGETWQNITHIINAFWSNLFVHQGTLFLLGTSQQYGSIVIRRSDDGGFTWTHPADERSGLLFVAGPRRQPPNYHCAPVPVVVKDGRLYRAFEDCTPCTEWGVHFHSLVISAPADADLLDAANWRASNRLAFDPAWAPAVWTKPCWLEGNVVSAPSGELWNILRLNSTPEVDKAARIRILDEGRRISFDPVHDIVDFPGGMTKFTIRCDPETGLYLTLVNNNTHPQWPHQRNVLSLFVSKDLQEWRQVKTLMQDRSGLTAEDSVRLTGFQYVDWQFDGEGIIYLVRAAYRGAIRFHDSNRILFCVERGFRSLLA